MNRMTWMDVENAVKKLAYHIRVSNFKPDYLIGITTGGLFPLGLLAKELKVKNILTTTAKSNNDNENGVVEIVYIPNIDLTNNSVLLIDDVTDRGATLHKVANEIIKRCKPKLLKTATIAFDVNKCDFMPDYHIVKQETDWVVFPWEKGEKFGPYSWNK